MKQPDRQCPMQHDNMIDYEYCQDAQQRDICAGCKHNEGRDVSRFVEKMAKQHLFNENEHHEK